MKIKKNKIYIIGAGVSGLTAANYLESKGFFPTIIEATDRVGGRVKTDIINNYQLDHGFQVLLTAYPLAKKYLDFEKLELQKINPGALIFKSRKKNSVIGDPLRGYSLLWKTIFTDLASIKDKLLIFKLTKSLKRQSLNTIFSKKSVTTLEYLKNYGFSDKVIVNFFKPFFSGIFLENKLDTSSIMFEYVFKMFSEGYAAIPKSGMKAIPIQLKEKLKQTKFIFNSYVMSVKEGILELKDGRLLKSDFIINTTEYDLSNNCKNETLWNSCENLYFEVEKYNFPKPLIGLVAREDTLINNIFCTTSIDTTSKGNKELISITIVKNHSLNDEELILKVKEELSQICNINQTKFIKKYTIKKALPIVEKLIYQNNIEIKGNLFNAGDVRANPSLNAAMLSGETAAKMIVSSLTSS